MYPQATVDLARQLSALGILDRENAAIFSVSIRAIRHWRGGTRRPRPGPGQPLPACPRCHGHEPDENAYAYLLGRYLGDGRITRGRNGVYTLSIYCCDGWPGLMEQAKIAMSAVMPSNKVFSVSRTRCTEIKSASKHWPCLFPQHGPGKKHERRIELEIWQSRIVAGHPGAFARGLFHSDGYRGINRIRRPLTGGDRWYGYPRYLFENHSPDIRELCGEALDRLGVAWRLSRPTAISVARREAVARLDEFVGRKY